MHIVIILTASMYACMQGLPTGPEGPMVHIGASVGAVTSRWYTAITHTASDADNDKESFKYQFLKNV